MQPECTSSYIVDGRTVINNAIVSVESVPIFLEQPIEPPQPAADWPIHYIVSPWRQRPKIGRAGKIRIVTCFSCCSGKSSKRLAALALQFTGWLTIQFEFKELDKPERIDTAERVAAHVCISIWSCNQTDRVALQIASGRWVIGPEVVVNQSLRPNAHRGQPVLLKLENNEPKMHSSVFLILKEDGRVIIGFAYESL